MEPGPDLHWYDNPWARWGVLLVEIFVAGAIVRTLGFDQRPWDFILSGVLVLLFIGGNYLWLRRRRAVDEAARVPKDPPGTQEV
jgi:hypothetical protein